VTGTFVVDGFDASDTLTIRSTVSGTAATINFLSGSGASFASSNYIDVKDNILLDNSTGITLPVSPTNSTNSGNTTGWFNTVLSGTVYTDK
jgi:hypothetical protein